MRLARALPPSGGKTGSIALGVLFALQIAVAVPLFIVAPEPLAEGPIPPHFPALHAAHAVLATLLLTTSAYLVAAVGSRSTENPHGRLPRVADPTAF